MGRDIHLDAALEDYMIAQNPDEPPLFQELRAETAALGDIARMQIGWVQARFMQSLVLMLNAKNVIEIGVFTGYSAMAVASILPPGGMLHALDIDDRYPAIGEKYWKRAGLADKINLILGDAKDSLQSLLQDGKAGTIDMVFIDADKSAMPHYLDQAHSLLRIGGVALCDNVLWSGAVIKADDDRKNTEAIRHFNRALKDDTRFHVTLIPVGDGMTLCVKK